VEFVGAITLFVKSMKRRDEHSATQPQPKKSTAKTRRAQSFEIAFLRALGVFAVKISLTAGQGFARIGHFSLVIFHLSFVLPARIVTE